MTDEERERIIADCPPPEDRLTKWRREMEEQEKRFAEERAAEAQAKRNNAIDWSAVIDRKIAAERAYQGEVLTHLVAEIRAEATDDLERATRLLTAELADLKATLAELRLVMAADRSKVLDLPNPIRQRDQLN